LGSPTLILNTMFSVVYCQQKVSVGQTNYRRKGDVRVGLSRRQKMSKEKICGSIKTLEMKFVPHGIGKDRQTVTYQTVKDYIMKLVQKSFRNGKDVADSLRKMEKIDMTKNMPTRKVSRETGTDNATEERRI
jgi:hypothetical protein